MPHDLQLQRRTQTKINPLSSKATPKPTLLPQAEQLEDRLAPIITTPTYPMGPTFKDPGCFHQLLQTVLCLPLRSLPFTRTT